jgi:hypothetical protein
MVAVEPRRIVMSGGGKLRNSFSNLTPPLPYTGPPAKAGSVIKGTEKNFLLKSLRSLSQKLDSKY